MDLGAAVDLFRNRPNDASRDERCHEIVDPREELDLGIRICSERTASTRPEDRECSSSPRAKNPLSYRACLANTAGAAPNEITELINSAGIRGGLCDSRRRVAVR